ncbi:hypothetical protein [Runella sp. SP2]|uniref:hypothetical protein n=1 Tax=Runella sp. SP2 TaxID=2268026 RepID=UPI000F073284|nr:hypothetical protein [Runella sp. SP2]AYQ34382.1 hypothetical protein DTQ70_20445 [Runella sp. SP2]
MKKQFWTQILFVCIRVYSCFGQNSLEYYSKINEAELAILDSNYSKSCSYYRDAFKINNSSFAKDYYNAAIVAAYVKDTNLIIHCFSQLARKGVCLSYLKKQHSWSLFKENYDLSYFEKIQFQKFREDYLKSTNFYLKRKLDNIYETNQDILLKNYPDSHQRHINNINELDSLIRVFGFPSEELIGVGDSLEVSPMYLYSIYNLDTQGYKNNIFFDLLKKATIHGKIHPGVSSFYLSLLNPLFELEKTAVYKIVTSDTLIMSQDDYKSKINKWVYPIYPENYLQKINKNRQEIGWEDFLTYQRKVIYNLKNNNFIFSLNGGLSTYQCDTEYVAQKYLNNVQIIENTK